MSSSSRTKGTKASYVMTTQQAQELLDRNAETMREIIQIQLDLDKNGLDGLSEAVERKERLMARLHRRLLKLSRWCDTSEAERKRADDEYEMKQIKALDQVLAHGEDVKQSARKLLSKPGRSRGQSLKYEGVFVDKTGKWVAQVASGGKSHFLGRYNSEEEAAIAWGKAMQAPKQPPPDFAKVKLGDKTVDLRGKDPLLDMNYSNAMARGVTPAPPPPAPAPLKVQANVQVSETRIVTTGSAPAESAESRKRTAEAMAQARQAKAAAVAAAKAAVAANKKVNTWKPFQCPEDGCSKCYTHQRACANHPKRLCVKADQLARDRARQSKHAKKKKQESSSSEESSSDDDSDDDDDDDSNKAASSTSSSSSSSSSSAAPATTAGAAAAPAGAAGAVAPSAAAAVSGAATPAAALESTPPPPAATDAAAAAGLGGGVSGTSATAAAAAPSDQPPPPPPATTTEPTPMDTE